MKTGNIVMCRMIKNSLFTLSLLCIMLLLASISAMACVIWSPGAAAQGGAVVSPVDNTVVAPGSTVDCEVSTLTDTDLRSDHSTSPFTNTNVSDVIVYWWYASQFSHEGRTVTWTAPTTPGQYTLYCTMDDEGAIPYPGIGNRQDVDIQRTTHVIVKVAVQNVTSNIENKAYKVGDTIDIQMLFNCNVNVTGSPRLELETGTTNQIAEYHSGSGTNTLTFRYVVQSGDTASDLDYVNVNALSLNGGSIKQVTTNVNADLALPAPGASGSLGANKDIAIDTVAPTVTTGAPSVTSTSTGPVTYQATFSEPVTGFDASADIEVNASGNASAGSVDVIGTGTGPYAITLANITGEGTIGITIKSASCTDIPGNPNSPSSASATFIVSTAPVITDDGLSTTIASQLHATWTLNGTASPTFKYAIGTSPTLPPGTLLVDWTDAGTNTSVTHPGLSLSVGTTYYFYIKAIYESGIESTIGISDGITVNDPIVVSLISDLYTGTLNTYSISNKVCIVGNDAFTNEFYIEESDKSAGIRVKYSGAAVVTAGKLVSVVGQVRNDSQYNEFTLYADSVQVGTDTALPEPVERLNKGLGGCTTGFAIGVDDCTYAGSPVAYNKGLLVTSGGEVRYVDLTNKYFVINDVSCAKEEPTGSYGIRVSYDRLINSNDITIFPSVGCYCSITGISSSMLVQGSDGVTRTVRVLRPRNQADLGLPINISFDAVPNPIIGQQTITARVSNFDTRVHNFSMTVDGNKANLDKMDTDYDNGVFTMFWDAASSKEGQHIIMASAEGSSKYLIVNIRRGTMSIVSDKMNLRADGFSGDASQEECNLTATITTPDGDIPADGTAVTFYSDHGTFTDVTTAVSGVAHAKYHSDDYIGKVNIHATGGGASSKVQVYQAESPSEIRFAKSTYTLCPDMSSIVSTAVSQTTIKARVTDENGIPVADGTAVSYTASNANIQILSTTPTIGGISSVIVKAVSPLQCESVLTATIAGSIDDTSKIYLSWPVVQVSSEQTCFPACSPDGIHLNMQICSIDKEAMSGIPISLSMSITSDATLEDDIAITDTDGVAEAVVNGNCASTECDVFARIGDKTSLQHLILTKPDKIGFYSRVSSANEVIIFVSATDSNFEDASRTLIHMETDAGQFSINGVLNNSVELSTEHGNKLVLLKNIPSGGSNITASTNVGELQKTLHVDCETTASIKVLSPSSSKYRWDLDQHTVDFSIRVIDTRTGEVVPEGTSVQFDCTNGSVTPTSATCDDEGIVSGTLTASAAGICKLTCSVSDNPLFGSYTIEFMFAGVPASIESSSFDIAKMALSDSEQNIFDFSASLTDAGGVYIGNEESFTVSCNGNDYACTSYAGYVHYQIPLNRSTSSVDLRLRSTRGTVDQILHYNNLNRHINAISISAPSSIKYSRGYEYVDDGSVSVSVSVIDSLGEKVPTDTPVHLSVTAGAFMQGLPTIDLPTIDGSARTIYTSPIITSAALPENATITATVGSGTDMLTDSVDVNFYH